MKISIFLSYGVSIAGFIQAFLVIFVKRFYKPKLKFNFNISKMLNYFSKLLPLFSSGVTQINILVGTIIASFRQVQCLFYIRQIYQINLAMQVLTGTAITQIVFLHSTK